MVAGEQPLGPVTLPARILLAPSQQQAGRYPGDVFGQAGRKRLSVSAKGHLPAFRSPAELIVPGRTSVSSIFHAAAAVMVPLLSRLF